MESNPEKTQKKPKTPEAEIYTNNGVPMDGLPSMGHVPDASKLSHQEALKQKDAAFAELNAAFADLIMFVNDMRKNGEGDQTMRMGLADKVSGLSGIENLVLGTKERLYTLGQGNLSQAIDLEFKNLLAKIDTTVADRKEHFSRTVDADQKARYQRKIKDTERKIQKDNELDVLFELIGYAHRAAKEAAESLTTLHAAEKAVPIMERFADEDCPVQIKADRGELNPDAMTFSELTTQGNSFWVGSLELIANENGFTVKEAFHNDPQKAMEFAEAILAACKDWGMTTLTDLNPITGDLITSHLVRRRMASPIQIAPGNLKEMKKWFNPKDMNPFYEQRESWTETYGARFKKLMANIAIINYTPNAELYTGPTPKYDAVLADIQTLHNIYKALEAGAALDTDIGSCLAQVLKNRDEYHDDDQNLLTLYKALNGNSHGGRYSIGINETKFISALPKARVERFKAALKKDRDAQELKKLNPDEGNNNNNNNNEEDPFIQSNL